MANQIPVKKLLFVLVLATFQFGVRAQNPAGGVIFGANIGTSKIFNEVTPDFKPIINEFNHQAGFIFEPELSKLLGNHFEIGTSFGVSTLKGKTDNPQFSAEGHHPAMLDPITEPVKYKTKLMGQKFYFGYYFRSFSKIDKSFKLEPFLRMGAGYFYYTSDFSYQDPALGTIFGKGVEGYTDLTTGVFFGTAGLKMYLNPKVFLNASYTFNYVRYDFLDAVHNYNAEGYRDRTTPDIRGIYSDIKFGIFYQFGNRGVKSGKTGTPGAYLPFSKL